MSLSLSLQLTVCLSVCLADWQSDHPRHTGWKRLFVFVFVVAH